MKQSAVDNIETRLTAFLGIFNTGIDILLPVAEIYAVLDSHGLRVRIGGRCERARRGTVPNLCQKSENRLFFQSSSEDQRVASDCGPTRRKVSDGTPSFEAARA